MCGHFKVESIGVYNYTLSTRNNRDFFMRIFYGEKLIKEYEEIHHKKVERIISSLYWGEIDCVI